MDKKKILIVCKTFYPDISPRSFRATELAKELASEGYDVTVLTSRNNPDHIWIESKYGFVIKDLGKTHWKNPNFGKSKIGYFFTRAFYRFLSIFFEYPSLEYTFMVKKYLKNEIGYDLLISIAAPYAIHWGVAKAKEKNRLLTKTWVADCGDPFLFRDIDTFSKPFYFKYIDKWFLSKPDYISIPVESAKNAYNYKYHEKIVIIPQGFKFNASLRLSKKRNIRPTFAYAGTFIPRFRDPRPFLDFLSDLKNDFCFIVFTRDGRLIQPYKDKLKDKLIINTYVSRDALMKTLVSMDFLVNFDNNTSTVVPSKLIDYALTGKPILNVEKLMNEKVIQQFFKGDYSSSMKIKNLDQYRIENVCKQFIKLIEDEG